MAWSDPVDPVSNTVITVAYAVANFLTQIRWLRQLTGNADPPASNRVVVSTSTTATNWAQVPTDAIANNAVTTAKIADAAVQDTKIADGHVTTVKITNNAVTTAKIADANVTTAKLADGAVTDVKIQDSHVTTAKLVNGAVTTAKIADGNVTTVKLADANVTTAKIADANVTTAKLADGAVTSAKIADGTIATGDLADGAITSAKIADGTITDTDVAAANKDGSTGTASLRTLGTGAQQAAAGDHTHSNPANMGVVVSGSYTGNGAGSRTISGLGITPKFVIIQRVTGSTTMGFLLGHDAFSLLSGGFPGAFSGSSLAAGQFTVPATSGLNSNGDTFNYVAIG